MSELKIGDVITFSGVNRKRTWLAFFLGKPKPTDLQKFVITEIVKS